ncbi:MAG: RNA-binding protein [Proteobacteria bacterium]|jgi:RNA recognition motif-containing protein|nr:MAG: RNA-binding protein [Pseudomonadota bacterium]
MGKKLYVGNLPYSATEQVLIDTFSQCGVVESAKIIVDRETGRSKGFGFVEMATDDEAAEAIKAFHGADYSGRSLTVNEARPQAPREERGGFGGGQSRGGDRGGDRGGQRGDRGGNGGGYSRDRY